MKTVVILAGGTSTRWSGKCKHLLALWDGETVISRMIRQVRGYGIEPIVATRNLELIGAVDAPIHDVGMTTSVFETALLTRDLWLEETALLLGDVVFSDAVIANIMAGGPGLRIFTNPRETYAMSFSPDVFNQVEAALWSQAQLVPNGGQGSLRAMCQFVRPSTWVIVADLTDDIDTPEKYEGILARWDKLEEVRR